jgi:hypothetical protein
MALSKKTAIAIIDAVASDSESQATINVRSNDSPATKVVPASWGITGALRNFAHVISFSDPTDPKVERLLCTGIARTTSRAIDEKLSGTPGIPEVSKTEVVSREKPISHTATVIVMKDGSKYVFDWHKSLDVHNPWIYKLDDWKLNQGGLRFLEFKGW